MNNETKEIISKLKSIQLSKSVSAFYKLGMFLSSFIMVILPLVYLSMIFFVGFIVKWHFVHNTGILGGTGGFYRLIIYVSPGIIGSVLIISMLYPFKVFFTKQQKPDLLNKEDAPILFDIIYALSDSVGNKRPSEILVDNEANASASFKPGLINFIKGNLRLTLGLPLIKSLKMNQLLGVIAHEFGHFSQGSGMRLTFIVRYFNYILAEMAHGDEELDEKLQSLIEQSNNLIGIALLVAKGFLWLTRKIVFALYYIGAISSNYLLRQMEFDADWFEINVSGTKEFEKTSDKIFLLSYSSQWCLNSIGELQLENKIIKNIPEYVDHALKLFDTNDVKKLLELNKEHKTKVLDTHPCDTERIKHAETLNKDAIIITELLPQELFCDFEQFSENLTKTTFETYWGVDYNKFTEISTIEAVDKKLILDRSYKLYESYLDDINLFLFKPFKVSDGSFFSSEENDLSPLKGMTDEYGEIYTRIFNLKLALELREAKKKINLKSFELTTDKVDDIKLILIDSEKKLADLQLKMSDLITYRDQMISAKLFEKKEELIDITEIETHCRFIEQIYPLFDDINAINLKNHLFTMLFENDFFEFAEDREIKVHERYESQIKGHLQSIHEKLEGIEYPFIFDESRKLSLRESLGLEDKLKYTDNPFQLADSVAGNLLFIYTRSVGRLLSYVYTSEEEKTVIHIDL